jgi:deazaflavin-dependent oxidoreductase (nitroreductase family)
MRTRYSQAQGRRLTAYEQIVERMAASRVGAWTFLHVFNPVDQRLLPLTRGRVSVAVGAPVGLLESRGARTNRRRRTPLLYFLDDEAVVLVASNVGSPRNPAWLHNLRRDPDVRFLCRERGWRAYRARVLTGAERARAWERATDLYAGYSDYQGRAAGREIPVVVLEPQRGIVMPPAT